MSVSNNERQEIKDPPGVQEVEGRSLESMDMCCVGAVVHVSPLGSTAVPGVITAAEVQTYQHIQADAAARFGNGLERPHMSYFPAPPPPSPPTSEDPWRKTDWTRKQKEDLQRFVRDYQPKGSKVEQLRVLIYGPVGAGKSSFINSVITAIRGQSYIRAAANAAETATKSFTVKYEAHKIQRQGEGHHPIVFYDIMGLEDGENFGVRAEDIQLAMKGHVKEGYEVQPNVPAPPQSGGCAGSPEKIREPSSKAQFNPTSTLSMFNGHYKIFPTPNDQVHVLVCLLNVNSPNISPSVIQKMKAIRETARDLGIPQIAIAAHIDECCDEIEKDVKDVYKSTHLKKKMTEFSNAVGIPLNCIFPVKNYSTDSEPDDDMDILILTAVKHILNYGDDFLHNMQKIL
ncbi:interferon-induced protein 44-like [Sphaeramia orbicularis]|uniref:interferon-induced protein 44-like n=1 Tax=Sphaeramia orbicularis TaxID=375764 RepID=UPI00117BE4F8|nr:interferon-induced protein 44-like [Sphaeramia orbicularis]